MLLEEQNKKNHTKLGMDIQHTEIYMCITIIIEKCQSMSMITVMIIIINLMKKEAR